MSNTEKVAGEQFTQEQSQVPVTKTKEQSIHFCFMKRKRKERIK